MKDKIYITPKEVYYEIQLEQSVENIEKQLTELCSDNMIINFYGSILPRKTDKLVFYNQKTERNEFVQVFDVVFIDRYASLSESQNLILIVI